MSLPAWQENHPSSVQQNGLGPVLLEGMKQVKGIQQGISHRGFTLNIAPGCILLHTEASSYNILGFPKESVPTEL